MNCKKRCNSIRDAHARDEMLKDIKLIQLSPTEAHFTSAVDAFKQEYEGKGEEFHQFVQYFEEQWVNAVPCWYEGMHLDEVMNNCGIEGTNKAIKEDGTYRERLNLLAFTDVISKMVARWSAERNPLSPNCVSFVSEPSRTLADWTAAYQWALSNAKNIVKTYAGVRYFVFLSRACNVTLTANRATRIVNFHVLRREFEDMEDVRLYMQYARVLEDDAAGGYKCSCIDFKKEYKCTHSLGALIRERRVPVPLEAKDIPVGQKRRRGRVSMARPALVRQ
jgi:hypothetical protein